MACGGNQFLNEDFDIDEYIAQAPTPPPPSSLLLDPEWVADIELAGISDCADFGVNLDNLEAYDCNLTNSQKLTLGQSSADVFFHQPQTTQQVQLQPVQFVDNHQLDHYIKEEPVDSIVSTSGTHARSSNNISKCMNRNAIAARENRAKKKSEFDQLKRENAVLKVKMDQYHRENKDLKNKNARLTERNNYLEKSARDTLRMQPFLAQFSGNEKYRTCKRQQAKNKVENPIGICLYIRPDNVPELRMCENCANHNAAANGVTVPCMAAGSQTT